VTTAAKQAAGGLSVDVALRMYRQMAAIRAFEERVNDLYTRALMPGWRTCTSVKKQWPLACARRCGATTTSRAPIAGMGTAWRKARRRR
jgi:hypothetical protein